MNLRNFNFFLPLLACSGVCTCAADDDTQDRGYLPFPVEKMSLTRHPILEKQYNELQMDHICRYMHDCFLKFALDNAEFSITQAGKDTVLSHTSREGTKISIVVEPERTLPQNAEPFRIVKIRISTHGICPTEVNSRATAYYCQPKRFLETKRDYARMPVMDTIRMVLAADYYQKTRENGEKVNSQENLRKIPTDILVVCMYDTNQGMLFIFLEKYDSIETVQIRRVFYVAEHLLRGI